MLTNKDKINIINRWHCDFWSLKSEEHEFIRGIINNNKKFKLYTNDILNIEREKLKRLEKIKLLKNDKF